MAKLISLDPVRYVLKSELETPEAEQTIWHVKPLTWTERASVQDGMLVTEISMLGPKDKAQTGTMRHLSGTQSRVAVEKGLVKIENLRDQKGELVTFNETSNAEHKGKIYDMIPPEWSKELAEVILRMSGLLKDEEKN